MNRVRLLRSVLYLQAAALAVPVLAGVVYVAAWVVTGGPGHCASGQCGGPAGLALGSLFFFGGPIWWAVSGAGRAELLRTRQLVWLIAVDVYLVLLVTILFVLVRGDVPQTFSQTAALSLAVAVEVIATGALSAGVCMVRIWQVAGSAGGRS